MTEARTTITRSNLRCDKYQSWDPRRGVSSLLFTTYSVCPPEEIRAAHCQVRRRVAWWRISLWQERASWLCRIPHAIRADKSGLDTESPVDSRCGALGPEGPLTRASAVRHPIRCIRHDISARIGTKYGISRLGTSGHWQRSRRESCHEAHGVTKEMDGRAVRVSETRKWAEWRVSPCGSPALSRASKEARGRVAGHVLGRQMGQGSRIWGIDEVEEAKKDAGRLRVRKREMSWCCLQEGRSD